MSHERGTPVPRATAAAEATVAAPPPRVLRGVQRCLARKKQRPPRTLHVQYSVGLSRRGDPLPEAAAAAGRPYRGYSKLRTHTAIGPYGRSNSEHRAVCVRLLE